ncbi:MAG: hypothetical protein PW844_19990 [Pantoea sp.]|uniref:hypothetical protein n=1 Tax=Pantoea sp. TaxID=69393 RepID=UPI00239BA6D2|nr:hypothetical protein [Pantoea sp.]MDE1188714.1 hypothetical protein [Pantoea sp.]
MSMNLKEKLKVAKERNEFRVLKDLILSKNDIKEYEIIQEDIDYQAVIDIAFERQVLLKNECDARIMKKNFKSFVSGIDDNEDLTFCTSTIDNVFFIRLQAGIIKRNIDFFWGDERLYKNSQDRIFFSEKKNKGFTVLKSEYGLEVAEW